jgi:hypothetical protein
MTLAVNTVYPYGSTDTNFYPPQFSLDSTFNPNLDDAKNNSLTKGIFKISLYHKLGKIFVLPFFCSNFFYVLFYTVQFKVALCRKYCI